MSLSRALLGIFSFLATTAGVSSQTATADSNVDLSPLGTQDLSVYKFGFGIKVDDNCDYTFTIEFIHPPSFFLGDQNTTCKPGVIAPDGLPYNDGRWYWDELPAYIQNATGFNHISLDWNPCGHPGNGFLTPHTDVHMYTVTPQFRVQHMVCNLLQQTIVCQPNAQAGNTYGEGFFVAALTSNGTFVNMPAGFTTHPFDAVQHMGMHAWNGAQEPATPEQWIVPILILVTYGKIINAFEPMLPFDWTNGTVDQFFEEKIAYVDQTQLQLPNYFSVYFNAQTQVTTITTTGKSGICKQEFDAAQLLYQQEIQKQAASRSGASALPIMTSLTMLFAATILEWIAAV